MSRSVPFVALALCTTAICMYLYSSKNAPTHIDNIKFFDVSVAVISTIYKSSTVDTNMITSPSIVTDRPPIDLDVTMVFPAKKEAQSGQCKQGSEQHCHLCSSPIACEFCRDRYYLLDGKCVPECDGPV